MREICLAKLDKTRPVLVLTREVARSAMTKVTVAPITSTVKGLSSEVELGERNGLDHRSAASLDNAVTIPSSLLGRTIGFLQPDQERALANAAIMAFDLDARPLES
ncbi:MULTISPECIES: type II toxin-antitoxin system PemK/MazF family toxin [Dermabacter]|uniref:mRNA interferase MazF3 n=1 Tax=Dermabacter jinjuensis TaxID=1667168 RepID=A0ABM6PL70_9MICO|nr:type II toxin-antitoxin system PemK/MazF family toxin [Dermabacter jinjuensis]ATH96053.1 mRNA interferase MazF3 [Dermabacter jinjuensis]MDK8804094.1 type II toxin-antitoxin system PemK/MazF family toxin [Dermabacter hominis]MDU2598063.1 type II toxin-antitoxin system PemK/MazF family toxin [Dermabacter sp.]UEB90122.1 type II toxin-antitoxin system PemK/MazF family toxin [Dermabacter jinjuensis]